MEDHMQDYKGCLISLSVFVLIIFLCFFHDWLNKFKYDVFFQEPILEELTGLDFPPYHLEKRRSGGNFDGGLKFHRVYDMCFDSLPSKTLIDSIKSKMIFVDKTREHGLWSSDTLYDEGGLCVRYKFSFSSDKYPPELEPFWKDSGHEFYIRLYENSKKWTIGSFATRRKTDRH